MSERPLVLVGDTAYAVIEFLAATRSVATIVTRLRLDARLFDARAPARPRADRAARVSSGTRLPTLAAR